MYMRPVLLNSCAMAATAEEARYRIDRAIAPSRAARVVALDSAAVSIVRRVAEQPWTSARFYTGGDAAPEADEAADVELRSFDGARAWLSDELADVDVAVMVATDDEGAPLASTIGRACALRGIMTAGLILGDGRAASAAVSALRPHARVLMVSTDEHDVSDVLTALRA